VENYFRFAAAISINGQNRYGQPETLVIVENVRPPLGELLWNTFWSAAASVEDD